MLFFSLILLKIGNTHNEFYSLFQFMILGHRFQEHENEHSKNRGLNNADEKFKKKKGQGNKERRQAINHREQDFAREDIAE